MDVNKKVMSRKKIYYEELDKVLGEPVIFEFSDSAMKAKNHLMTVSVIGILISLFGITVASDSTLFGLKFNNLSNNLIVNIILLLNIYFWFKFAWLSIEYIMHWRIRVTGSGEMALRKIDRHVMNGIDYSDDIKQTSLYNWWLKHAKYFRDNTIDPFKNIEEIKEKIKDNNWSMHRGSISELLDSTEEHLKAINDVFGNMRLEVSLAKFDKSYLLFLRVQNWRWFIFDFMLPQFLGLISIMSLCLYTNLKFGLLLFWI